MEPQAQEHDYDLFLSRVREIAAHRRYATETLGTPFEDPLVRLSPMEPRPESQPRLLIGAGFHGYEISGPWGLLHFLELAPDALLARACIECFVTDAIARDPASYPKVRPLPAPAR